MNTNLIILFIIAFFIYFNLSNINNFVLNINKIYKCSKALLLLIPLVILYFNKDMTDTVMEYLGYFDKTGLYNSRKDLSFHLKKINNAININNTININKKNIKKRNVSESKKKYVASNQKWRCGNCNNILDATYEVDHIIPLYKGGNNDLTNLMAMCRNCHGNKTLQDRIN